MKDIFFSYSRNPHGEELVALGGRIAQRLGRPGDLFVDQNIRHGDDWRTAIRAAISSASVFLCVLEPAYWRSPHCRQEAIEALHRHEQDEGFHILPLYFRGVDSADLDVDAMELHARLRQLQGVDAREAVTVEVEERVASAIRELLTMSQPDVAPRGGAPGALLEATRDLLVSCFSLDELTRFMRSKLHLRGVLHELPAPRTLAMFVFKLVLRLERQPALGLSLLYDVRRERPGRVDEIDAVLEGWRRLDAALGRIRTRNPKEELKELLLQRRTEGEIRKLLRDVGAGDVLVFAPRQSTRVTFVDWLVEALAARYRLTVRFRDALRAGITVGVGNEVVDVFSRLGVPKRRQALIDLLLDLFGYDRSLFWWWLMGDVLSTLMRPIVREDCSLLDLVRMTVEEAELAGMLDERFFSRLILLFAERAPDIRVAARPWVDHVPGPERRFWEDRLVMIWAELCEADPRAYTLVLEALGLTVRDQIEGDISWIHPCRYALNQAKARGLFIRSVFAVLADLSPASNERLVAIEAILLSEEGPASPFVRLPVRVPSPESGEPTPRERLFQFLCEHFATAELRVVAFALSEVDEDVLSHLPEGLVTRGDVAFALLEYSETRGLLPKLFDYLMQDRQALVDEIARLRSEILLEESS